jgi:hypothetical protein
LPEGYRAHPEQAFIFDLAAWDANCPQHIPKRVEAPDMEAAIAARDQTILQLSARVNELTRRLRELGGDPAQQ